MKKFALLLLLALSFAAAQAQPNAAVKPAAAEKSDPEAKKVLDKIRKKYESYKTLEATFALDIEIPGEQKAVQKGTVSQAGDKFRLEMDQQTIVSDGKTTWVYVRKNNEVQISDAEPGGSAAGPNDFLTPRDLLSRYQKGDFLYALTDKLTEKGRILTQIEFKPKDRKSEYSKLRLSIDEKAGTIESVRAFAKDGSRYTFRITRLTPNKQYGAEQFTFDPKKYAGVRVEDLRM